MPPILSDEICQQTVDAYAAAGEVKAVAARALDLGITTFAQRLAIAQKRKFKAKLTKKKKEINVPDAILASIKRNPLTLEELSAKLGCTGTEIDSAIATLKSRGITVSLFGDRYGINPMPPPAFIGGSDLPTYFSRPDGTYLFGACGDNHIGSKYSRLDVLNELYDIYEEEGVDRVFNTGNWIDGEARFNMHDLLVHGMDAQLRELAKVYPVRKGLITYAVAGDDHEGWYAQKYGTDIGARAEHTMRDAKRTDWVNLGYMESHIRLVHSKSGAEQILAVVHPGGGSAYATSYSIQKIIESLEGGEKPAIGLYGHYHKLWFGNIRNVWAIQTGTTEDQTPFMRKKKLEAHVGGTLIRLVQDPKSGAIVRCRTELIRHFNRGFYNNRWNHGRDVVHAARSP